MAILINILTLGLLYFPSYDTIIDKVDTSKDMEYYLSYFTYKDDRFELHEWENPKQFYERRGGDCEGFAVLIYEVLTPKGYDCTIYGLYDDSRSHAIVMYEKGEDKGYFSNYIRYSVNTTIEEIEQDTGYTSHVQINWKIRHFEHHGEIYE